MPLQLDDPSSGLPNKSHVIATQPILSSQENLQNGTLSPKRMNKTIGGDSNAEMIISYVDDMRFNIAIREVFLNRFVQMFHSYEHFVLHAEAGQSQRDSVHTFDKVTITVQLATLLSWFQSLLIY